MFDLSFAEIMLSILVAAVFIGPKELPTVIKAVANMMRSVRSLGHEIRSAFNDLADESGLKDTAKEIEQEVKMIQGDDGLMHESYDLSEVMMPRPVIADEPANMDEPEEVKAHE